MSETTMIPESSNWTAPPGTDEVEQRLQRLEDMLAAACDTQALEDRVVERVQEKLKSERPPPVAAFAPDGTAPHPSEMEYTAAPSRHGPERVSSGFTWMTPVTLLGEMWWEVRALFRMVRDPAYKVTWLCRVVPLLCLLYVTVWSWVSAYLFGTIPIVSMLDDLVVIYLGLKILGRELRRYRDFEARWGRR